MFRTAHAQIKEVYDTGTAKQFMERYAAVIAEKESTAERKVVAIEPHFIYVVVSALHGDEPNYNGDFFRWSELLRNNDEFNIPTWETWIGKPVCENHDIKAVRGMIVDAWPIKAEKSIDMLHRVDERINPNLVKGIRNGSVKGTSMGVMVTRSYCSICNNLAYDEQMWCKHLSPRGINIKGKRYTGQDGNLYPHKVGQLCYENNLGLTGVEDSYITLGEPADPKAIARTVLASRKLTLANKE